MALAGQVGSWDRQACPPLSSRLGSSSQLLFCLFQPPGGVPGTQPLLPNSMDPTRQQGREGWVGRWGAGSRRGSSLYCLPLPLTAHLLSCRAPQHGRIHAENEPSPRHGTYGSRPTGNRCVSIHSPDHLCAPPSLLFHSLSVFPPRSACRDESRGCGQVPSYSLPQARWPHA